MLSCEIAMPLQVGLSLWCLHFFKSNATSISQQGEKTINFLYIYNDKNN